MTCRIFESARLHGSVRVPPAKDEWFRALLVAALGRGHCRVHGSPALWGQGLEDSLAAWGPRPPGRGYPAGGARPPAPGKALGPHCAGLPLAPAGPGPVDPGAAGRADVGAGRRACFTAWKGCGPGGFRHHVEPIPRGPPSGWKFRKAPCRGLSGGGAVAGPLVPGFDGPFPRHGPAGPSRAFPSHRHRAHGPPLPGG